MGQIESLPPGSKIIERPFRKELTIEVEGGQGATQIDELPEGSRLISDRPPRVPNAVETFAEMFPDRVGRPIAAAGRAYERGLGQMLSMPSAMTGAAQYTPEGARAAETLMSPGAARVGIEAAGGLLAPEVAGPLAAAKYGPTIGKVARAGASALGGAVGSLAAEPFDPSEKPLEQAAWAGALQLGGEGVSAAAAKIMGGGLRMTPEAEAAQRWFTSRGAALDPALVTKNPVVGVATWPIEQGLVGTERLFGARHTTEMIASDAANSFADALLPNSSPAVRGQLIRDALTRSREAFTEAGGRLYRRVDQLIGNQPIVEISNPRKLIDDIVYADNGRTPALQNKLQQWLINSEARGQGGKITFAEAQALRSDLLKAYDNTSGIIIGNKFESAAKRLSESLDRAMEVAAKTVGKQPYQAWRKANRFWKKGRPFFDEQVIRRIADAHPEEIYGFAVKSASPEAIQRLFSKIGNTAKGRRAIQAIRASAMEDILKSASDKDFRLLGSRMKSRLNKDWGPAKVNAIFGRDGGDNLRQIANALEKSQGRSNVYEPGGARTKAAQIGAAMAGFSVAGMLGVAASAATPALTSKLLTSPSVARWMTIGANVSPNSKLGARAAAGLAAAIADVTRRHYGDEGAKSTPVRQPVDLTEDL